MADKRPIDRQRESGGSVQLFDADAGDAIKDFYKIGEDRLLIVSTKAVFEIKLPDQIDPKRTNPHLKPVQQRVLDYGSNDEIVSRILLTAKGLFRENVLERQFNHVRALALAFDGVKDLVAMRQIHDELTKA